jgi:hypothetical protein
VTDLVEPPAIPICDDPIFVPGPPGSGADSVALALAVHTQLALPAQSNIVARLRGLGPLNVRAPRRFRKLPQNYGGNPNWPAEDSGSNGEYIRFMRSCLGSVLAAQAGGLRWIDTTPDSLAIADILIDMFHWARFLCIERDGRCAVSAMLERTGRAGTPWVLWMSWPRTRAIVRAQHWRPRRDKRVFRRACKAWASHVSRARELAEREPGRTLAVGYEELMTDPERAFREVCDFLRLPFEHGPVEHFLYARPEVSLHDMCGSAAPTASPRWTSEEEGIFSEELIGL